jgi:predicted nucleotidyltransferase
MNELANVNFIGLDYKSLLMINNILLKFKEKHKNDPNIECLLPDVLNELILEKKINMDYFEITENIIGLTHPEDETVVRKILC